MIWTAVIMKIRLALLLTLLFSVASVAPSFAAGERYALVIGNAKYPDAEAPLKEPINDARDIADELKRDGFNVEIGENAFIFENNVLQHKVRIGDDVVLWSGNHVGHRTVVHDHCFIASHVVISGFCEIGESSFVGVNATFSDGVKTGSDVVVGAGAVVIRDLEARGVYVGNPARATGGDSFDTFSVPSA